MNFCTHCLFSWLLKTLPNWPAAIGIRVTFRLQHSGKIQVLVYLFPFALLSDRWNPLDEVLFFLSISIRVSQKSCNILLTWGTIQLLLVLFSEVTEVMNIQGNEMSSSPDTLPVLRTGFASIQTDSWPCSTSKISNISKIRMHPLKYLILITPCNI